MAVPNLIKVVLHWSGFGEEGTIGLHMSGGPTASPQQLEDCLNAANTMLGNDSTPSEWTLLRGYLLQAQNFDRMQAYQYANSNGPATSQAEITVNHRGTAGASGAGLQQAVCVTLNTGAPGRRNRGRMYFPGHTVGLAPDTSQMTEEECQSIAELATAYIDDLRTSFQSTLGTNNVVPCVFSRAGQSARALTSASVDSRVDSQRRRAANQIAQFTYTAPITV